MTSRHVRNERCSILFSWLVELLILVTLMAVLFGSYLPDKERVAAKSCELTSCTVHSTPCGDDPIYRTTLCYHVDVAYMFVARSETASDMLTYESSEDAYLACNATTINCYVWEPANTGREFTALALHESDFMKSIRGLVTALAVLAGGWFVVTLCLTVSYVLARKHMGAGPSAVLTTERSHGSEVPELLHGYISRWGCDEIRGLFAEGKVTVELEPLLRAAVYVCCVAEARVRTFMVDVKQQSAPTRYYLQGRDGQLLLVDSASKQEQIPKLRSLLLRNATAPIVRETAAYRTHAIRLENRGSLKEYILSKNPSCAGGVNLSELEMAEPFWKNLDDARSYRHLALTGHMGAEACYLVRKEMMVKFTRITVYKWKTVATLPSGIRHGVSIYYDFYGKVCCTVDYYMEEQALLTNYHPDGRKEQTSWQGKERHRPHYEWWENGRLGQQGFYHQGKQHGVFQTWYEDGTNWSSTFYCNGLKEGLRTVWWENGVKKSEANYQSDRMQGRTQRWNQDGTRRRIKCRNQ